MWKQAWIAALAFCLPAAFAADEWPTKPVRFIVPSSAGASNDISARVIAERLSRIWRLLVVVETAPAEALLLERMPLQRQCRMATPSAG